MRHIKGQNNRAEIECPQNNRAEIECPPVVKDYAINMNGVDKSDREGRDNSVIITRSNRWYLRIWFRIIIERVVHCVYIIVCYVTKSGLRDDWKKYTSKHAEGRKTRFQLDLGF